MDDIASTPQTTATAVSATAEARIASPSPDAARRYRELAAMAKAFHDAHGVWGEEFSTL